MIAAALVGALVLSAVLALGGAARKPPRRVGGLGPASEREPPPWFVVRLRDVLPGVPIRRVWMMWLGGFPVSLLAGRWLGGNGLGLLSGAVWVALPFVSTKWLLARVERRRVQAVPSALDSIARSLRSGASLMQALSEAAGEAGPLKEELRLVVAEAERGSGVAAALDAWAERNPCGEVRLAAAALCMGAEMGGASARTVEGVAATVRQRLAVAGEARALTSQARISAQVIALAPLGFCALAAATDPAVARFLFATPLGWAFLLVGGALDLAGAVWMGKLGRT